MILSDADPVAAVLEERRRERLVRKSGACVLRRLFMRKR